MKKTSISIIIAFMAIMMCNAQKDQQFYSDITFATRSIWHGWDINSNEPVLHPYLEYSIGKTGLSIAAWASLPVNRNLNINDDIEFLIKYKTSFFNDETYKTTLNTFLDYIVCPNAYLPTDNSGEDTKMLWKYNLGFTLPSLIKIGDQAIVPGYNLYYIFPFGDIDFKAGSVHELSGYYTIPFLSTFKIGGTVNYHTGVFGAGSGWTHATTMLSSSVKLGSFNLNASLNKQWEFNQRPDIDDEFWVMIGINSKF